MSGSRGFKPNLQLSRLESILICCMELSRFCNILREMISNSATVDLFYCNIF